MLRKGRLMPFFDGDRLGAFITFYITDDVRLYINAYPWTIMEDNPEGTICYISQLITDKNLKNAKLSYETWRRFKEYIKKNFSQVRYISWRRFDKIKKIIKIYTKEI